MYMFWILFYAFISVYTLTMPHQSGIPGQRWYSIYLWKFKTKEKYVIKWTIFVPFVRVFYTVTEMCSYSNCGYPCSSPVNYTQPANVSLATIT